VGGVGTPTPQTKNKNKNKNKKKRKKGEIKKNRGTPKTQKKGTPPPPKNQILQ
jgi:hypothetical protein